MKGLWACSYAVSGFERDVLIRRAGLDGFDPASSGAVAQQLDVSVKRIRGAQRTGLRHLRAANRSDGCAMSSPSRAVGQTVGALRAVATAPALVTDGNVTVASAPSSPASEDGGQGEVLGEKRTSTDIHLERPQIAGTLSAAAAGGEDGSAPWLLILILALIAIAASTPLLLHRRRQTSSALAEPLAPPRIAVLPVPPPRVEPEPEPEPEPELVEPEPEPPPVEREPEQSPSHRYELPPAPWTEPEPEPEPDRELPSPPEPQPAAQHGARRAPGITFSAMASLAVTLMMRARRRR